MRLSLACLRWLRDRWELPLSFLTSMADPSPSSAWLSYIPHAMAGNKFRCWYNIPVRVPIPCTEGLKSHALSQVGSNQMDPSHYLHLADLGMDIRPSNIGIFCQVEKESDGYTRESVLCFDFQDGRWYHLLDELPERVKDVYRSQADSLSSTPFEIHLALLSSVVRWWSLTLSKFYEQVMSYVNIGSFFLSSFPNPLLSPPLASKLTIWSSGAPTFARPRSK
jgi:hypothetical protein